MHHPSYSPHTHPLSGAESGGANQSSYKGQPAKLNREQTQKHGFCLLLLALVPLLGMVSGCAGVVLTGSQSNPTGIAQLGLSSSNLTFGNVALNTTSTRNLTLTSSGSIALIVNSVTVGGAGFSISPGTFPATLIPGQSLTLQVKFDPASAVEANGSIRISSDSSTGNLTMVALRGTGVANPILSLSTASVDFGSVPVGTPISLPVMLTSTGTSPVTISGASISGTGFTFSGTRFPVTLDPTVSVTANGTCDPLTQGAASGTLTFTSDSTTGDRSVVTLTSEGTTVQHEVTLTWTAPAKSPVPVAGYDVYRAIGGSPSFQLLDFSKATTYRDLGVSASTTYIYYVTSVDGGGIESNPSNQATVIVP